MAPLHSDGITSVFVTLAIGFGFGFVLERSGFGNAHNLASQFYLHNMRVLKVMFTAIVTAMLLLFATSALGVLDFSQIWVPPTYFWPGVIGGVTLGVGFIIGGYCPGTSLVSAATLKVDGILFACGVIGGLLAFGETSPWLWDFYNQAGDMGRMTLFELLGVDAGVVVLGVVLMALGAFAFAELCEWFFATDRNAIRPASNVRMFRRVAVTTALLMAVGTLIIGQPTVLDKVARQEESLSAQLDSREIHIDPAELLDLMHNELIQLHILDVRSEAAFNRFHLADARRVTLAELEDGLPVAPTPNSVTVVMSNDEDGANAAWKRLAVHPNANAYVLAGGINGWLDIHGQAEAEPLAPTEPSLANDALRHAFTEALGSRHAASRPEPGSGFLRPFTPKVKLLVPVQGPGGGCG